MKRRRSTTTGSLDSLLDTMTNVVGILVILLTVTQLGVRDAVDRISANTSVDPDEFATLQRKLAETFRLHEALRKQWESLAAEQSEQDVATALRLAQKKLEDAQHDVEVLLANRQEERERREAELQALIDEANRIIEAQKREEQELVAKIHAAEAEIARLLALLEESPEKAPIPAKVVHLPNPRPAPEGKKKFLFLCRQGRVIPVNEERLQGVARKRVNYVIRRRALDRFPAAGIDGRRLVEGFNQNNTIRDRDFEIELTVQGRLPKLVLRRKEDAGEDLQGLRRSGSRYRRTLAQLDPRKYYVQYLVWPDSFEVYLEARRLAGQRGLDAGWRATAMAGEHVIDLGGDLRVGPPPKPKPKPVRPPGPPPEPAPKPPPRRPPPVDVID